MPHQRIAAVRGEHILCVRRVHGVVKMDFQRIKNIQRIDAHPEHGLLGRSVKVGLRNRKLLATVSILRNAHGLPTAVHHLRRIKRNFCQADGQREIAHDDTERIDSFGECERSFQCVRHRIAPNSRFFRLYRNIPKFKRIHAIHVNNNFKSISREAIDHDFPALHRNLSANRRPDDNGLTALVFAEFTRYEKFDRTRTLQRVVYGKRFILFGTQVLHKKHLARFLMESLESEASRRDGIKLVVAVFIRFGFERRG